MTIASLKACRRCFFHMASPACEIPAGSCTKCCRWSRRCVHQMQSHHAYFLQGRYSMETSSCMTESRVPRSACAMRRRMMPGGRSGTCRCRVSISSRSMKWSVRQYSTQWSRRRRNLICPSIHMCRCHCAPAWLDRQSIQSSICATSRWIAPATRRSCMKHGSSFSGIRMAYPAPICVLRCIPCNDCRPLRPMMKRAAIEHWKP